jgi:hypothetical protein
MLVQHAAHRACRLAIAPPTALSTFIEVTVVSPW